MRVVGLLIAGIPLASSLTAALMLAVAGRASPAPRGRTVLAAFAVLAATGSSSVLAFALGAGSVPAVLIVALGFALCSGVGLAPVFPSRVTRAP